jgi:hypothetical protein
MDESKLQAAKFLEKEIKTYAALSLFLSKKEVKERGGVGASSVVIRPPFYKERIKEAKKLVSELKKSN